MVEEGGSPGRVWTNRGSMQWCGRRGGGVLSLWSATLILLCPVSLRGELQWLFTLDPWGCCRDL